jgi:hypothetical protein
VVVQGRGLSRDELTDVADSLRPMTDDEWDAIRRVPSVSHGRAGWATYDADADADTYVDAGEP